MRSTTGNSSVEEKNRDLRERPADKQYSTLFQRSKEKEVV